MLEHEAAMLAADDFECGCLQSIAQMTHAQVARRESVADDDRPSQRPFVPAGIFKGLLQSAAGALVHFYQLLPGFFRQHSVGSAL